MRTKIDHAGRIVVPKAIRERLGFLPGTHIEILERSDGIVLQPVLQRPPLIREGLLLVHTADAGAALAQSDWIDEERDARIREIWSR